MSISKCVKQGPTLGNDFAARLYSDRFLNPNTMICFTHSNVDSSGREVCQSSVFSAQEGCMSVSAVVNSENNTTRPHIADVEHHVTHKRPTASGSFGDQGVLATKTLAKSSLFPYETFVLSLQSPADPGPGPGPGPGP